MDVHYWIIRLFEIFFSMKWIWLIIVILGYRLISKYLDLLENKYTLRSEELNRNTEYSEEKIINHLDYIINECIDQYTIFNLQPKNIYYINNKIETELLNYVSERIPLRISMLLMQQLRLVYNEDYVAEFIGSRIYMAVLNFVLEYNVNNNPDQNAKKATDAVRK